MAQISIFQKSCNQCGQSKPFDGFYTHRTAKDGLHPTCKDCVRHRSNEWRKRAVADGRYRLTKTRYRKSDKGKESIQKYELKESSKVKRRAAGMAWYERNRERLGIRKREPWTKERRTACSRKTSLKKKYGLSIDDYNQILLRQQGVCAICASPPSGRGNRAFLAVDHDHLSGGVRGLLCHKCNSGIGLLNDDPCLIDKARAYLLAYS